jgi:phosphohistidine phosphatase
VNITLIFAAVVPGGMDLILFRHGKAGKRNDYKGDDFFRPLTDEGIQDLIRIAGWLGHHGPAPDVIASSPLTRASQTAGIVGKELHFDRPPENWDELRPGTDPESVLLRMEGVPEDRTVILVGHEPDLSTLGAYILTGRKVPFFTLSKGGLALLEEVRPGQAGSGILSMLLPARLMK